MKIQNLAVIFIIIILPISMVLTVYVQNQVKTLELQIEYDNKLTNATYDALKAFQINTANSSTSDLANSKLRDIEASVNTFFNSVSSLFNMSGYNQDILKEYVPAIVYTMYDGYYIYSKYTNTLTDEDYVPGESTYQNEEEATGLKPYIHYSCRYVKGGIDVVITYTLDNFITIQGTINGNPVNESGYLINNCSGNGTNRAQYRGVNIGTEELKEYVIVPGETAAREYPYTQINGVKYYQETDGTGRWFYIMNDQKVYQDNIGNINNNLVGNNVGQNNAAVKYYSEAKEFYDFLESNGLFELKTSDAVDSSGNSLKDKFGEYYIFTRNDSGTPMEEPTSNFNQHRLAVIRYTIEKNLSIAIANYNEYSETSAYFRMPNLQEDEWETIINNVSVISFMQGLSIGGKIYNGYAIVTNTKNKEVVSEDSIYITTNDGQYHRVTDSALENNTNIQTGVFNMDFERRSLVTESGTYYYYPKRHLSCYNCIINQSTTNDMSNIYDYLTDEDTSGTRGNLAQIYFTALGRERKGMYRISNPVQTGTINTSTPSYDTIGPHGLGDINDDGIIDQSDVDMITQYLAGAILTEEQLRRADVNNDGSVGYRDEAELSAYVARNP